MEEKIQKIIHLSMMKLKSDLENNLLSSYPNMSIQIGSWAQNNIYASFLSIYLTNNYSVESIDPMVRFTIAGKQIKFDFDVSLSNGEIVGINEEPIYIKYLENSGSFIDSIRELCEEKCMNMYNNIVKYTDADI